MATTTSNDPSSADILRVALCQFAVSADKLINHQTASSFIQQAVNQNAQLIVLPEIWNGPYATSAFGDYAEDLSSDDAPSAALLQSLAAQHKVWIVGGSIAERDGDKLYNTCLIFDPNGVRVAKHRKVHLFDIDVPNKIRFLESETLSAGNQFTTFATPWTNVGVGICYDIRFASYASILCQKHQCRLLIYPGAFNLTTGPAHWELLQRARAVDNQCFVVTASPARTDATTENTSQKYPHYSAWGHSTVVAPWGTVIATTDERASVVVADLDFGLVEEMRRSIPIRQQARTDLYDLPKQK